MAFTLKISWWVAVRLSDSTVAAREVVKCGSKDDRSVLSLNL